ncbi:uncharacterized protein LOC112639676 [Camponotus floridanus]|uniref:uncharacterized protein LOC105258807 n=1 Tax=Camponotus floridanus TaxID=104421 RepID=UPI00059C4E89|nr:uncharacterized protein LOC105258807 [Camponotus floridanus]XP_025270296.1 uncharacterized protein LOC112639676 [Camponotus floridanus]
MSDCINENVVQDIVHINDEALATLVKSNPYLYNKKHKDFKNVEVKKDTWKVISTCCGATSGEEAENRWNQLRNQLGRKLREMKRKPPSGSEGGVKMTTWDLMPAMSFLIPHIEHRRTRGSMTFSHNSGPSTSPSGSSSNSENCVILPSPSSLDLVSDEISIEYDAEGNTCSSSPVKIISDDLDVFIDITNNDGDKKKQLNESDEKNAGFPSKKYKTAVPSLDTFSQQKKNKENNLELLIAKSSSAIQSMATCFTQDTLNETNKEKKMHPFVVAIEAAFEKVFAEMEMECFMAVMNVISKYQK